ncbi:VOC family protein [Maridesulfovibrio frigidus]|uniref:VOC family protein n=1 Tax=Maridesulfovibrio frigidus TaxID=340956 RepID=UPI0004E1B46F|nr:VOC family protein [Maridesulfovibrio frigidus]
MKTHTGKHLSDSPVTKLVATLILLAFFGLTGCASKIIVPPISETATDIHYSGKFVWFDLFTTDINAASNFYHALFGWGFQDTSTANPDVKTVFQNGKPIANMINRSTKSESSQWLSYMSVPDVDSAVVIVQNNNGSVYKDSKEFPDRGKVAIILDPQKAAVALLTSSTGDPQDGNFIPNRWLGCELWTTDVDMAVSFYQKLAGYEVNLVDVHAKVEYRMLFSDGKRRAGVVSIPWKDITPEWVPYILVEDVLQTTAKALELGGKILISPDMSVKEGHIAILSDPTGAVFGIQQLENN